MKQKHLSKNLEVSAIGLGRMGLSHGYGPALDDAEAIRLIQTSVDDLGYTLIDTAETYGYAGRPHVNEELVGRALKGARRERVKIVTKFGIHFDYEHDSAPYPLHLDSRPQTIRASVEGSLKRLGTDHIDLYLQHRIDPNVEPEEVASTMAELIAEGKVLNWGISEASEGYLRRAHAVCPVAAIENRYSMMARWHESLFPTLEELGIGFIAFSPLANGFLTGAVTKGDAASFDPATDYRASMPQFDADAIDKNQALTDFLAALAARHDATPAQVSLAWMCCKKPYIVPIPGSRHLDRLAQNAAAGDIELSADEVAAIDAALDSMDMSDVFGGSKAAK
ncbi:MAG: aldo/keto reductase [Tractidigestivibacter sp.]|uniref:aldo/keto reductase n=1 Tax=Tractidigestivibacter sp. TaxID=2847320 RepID=UPI003D94EA09